jgi:hypothetical protein
MKMSILSSLCFSMQRHELEVIRGRPSLKVRAVLIVLATLLSTSAPVGVWAQSKDAAPAASKSDSGQDLSEIGHKLSNPLADLWSLQFAFGAPQFNDGDVNEGDPELGADMVFQPVLHTPMFGSGEDEWATIMRPIVPLIFNTPIPKGPNSFDNKGGIGDIQLPILLSPPHRLSGNVIFGLGPVFEFPTATNDDLGSDQWSMGPAAVVGFKTDKLTLGVFPNWLWKIGSAGQGSKSDVKKMSILYFMNYMLPGAWQIGMNPTVTYNDRASSGNKWNVPVGPYVGRTILVGKVPLNIRVGAEYSVVSQDDFGQRFQFRLLITPVIPSLISKPIFGGAA